MRAELAELRQAALREIAACRTDAELEAIRVRYLGRKGSLNAILRGLGGLPADERPAVGALANEVKEAIVEALSRTGGDLAGERLRRSLAEDRIDVTMPGRVRPRGHAHPLSQVEEEIVDIFIAMGFRVAEGPEIEDDEHNFAALNFPPDHPARDTQDTLFVAAGRDDMLLRTHTSPVQIRVMRSTRPPVRVIVPGTVYRRDELDPTHSPMFHQIEGFMVDEHITFADLKGVLTQFLRRLFGAETRVRFRPSFFPFTEPSAEIDIAFGGDWLEILGSGMIHPNVLRACGYDPEAVRGFAFGMGTDRLVLLRHDLDDLRLLFENDVRFLGQFPG